MLAHPVQLLNINGNDGKLQFNQNTVNDLFMNPKVIDRKVVVFSIVGAFRKGKSFLLNYVLRYLYPIVSLHSILIIQQCDYVI